MFCEETNEICKLFEVLYSIDQRLLREAEEEVNNNQEKSKYE